MVLARLDSSSLHGRGFPVPLQRAIFLFSLGCDFKPNPRFYCPLPIHYWMGHASIFHDFGRVDIFLSERTKRLTIHEGANSSAHGPLRRRVTIHSASGRFRLLSFSFGLQACWRFHTFLFWAVFHQVFSTQSEFLANVFCRPGPRDIPLVPLLALHILRHNSPMLQMAQEQGKYGQTQEIERGVRETGRYPFAGDSYRRCEYCSCPTILYSPKFAVAVWRMEDSYLFRVFRYSIRDGL